jgi:hypothetical protein
MPESVDAIAAAILSAPAPVILPDTSSLLNVLEAPTPDERVSPNVIPAAITLSARAQANPAKLWVVVSEYVEEEWLRHHTKKRDRAVASIRHQDERISYPWSIASSMASAPAAPCLQFAGLQIGQRLHSVAADLIRSARVIGKDGAFDAAAGRRIAQDHAPASRGKSEFYDCVLIEQYLALCRRIRDRGFDQRCVFVSSNVRDFGEPLAPRPPLDAEFASAGLDYVYDLAAAMPLL